MNKLNIDCILKLLDQLSFEDTVKFKELVNESIWLIKDFSSNKFYLIRAKSKEEIYDIMIQHNLPNHKHFWISPNNCLTLRDKNDSWTDYKWEDDSTMINIVVSRDKLHCLLCNSNNCQHLTSKITCVKRSDLSTDDLKKILDCMVKLKFYSVEKICFDNEYPLFEFK